MSSIKQLKSGSYQLRIQNKLIPKGFFYATFDSRQEAEEYGDRIEGFLKQRILPAALLEKNPTATSWMLSRCIAEYVTSGTVPHSEVKILATIRPSLVHESTAGMNYAWCSAWVNRLKREENLSPSTIRHRVGALRRCLDWIVREHPEIIVINPLLQLKRGFATYTPQDEQFLKRDGKAKKADVERDRRLHEDEEPKVLAAMAGMPDETVFFTLALETSMRMREIYTITLEQVMIDERTIHLLKTKNGDNRQVPLSSKAKTALGDYIKKNKDEIKQRDGRVFPFWNGKCSADELDQATSDVSRIFRKIFKTAGLKDFVFHDIRHEAICRFFLHTTLSETQIARITGHKDPRMLRRYLSLRGSDLAAYLK